mgnify:CR=1 FL=1
MVRCNDQFFGAAERLLQPQDPIFVPGRYDEHGKWMDGWETRRRREPGSDHCTIELGAPARLFGLDIDTAHFNGNQPESAIVWGALCDHCPDDDSDAWFELLPRVPLGPDSRHRHELDGLRPVSHLRLEIFPDGGVARLRAYGVARRDWPATSTPFDVDDAGGGEETDGGGDLVDLVALENGGEVVSASDEHFGAATNLILPGRGVDMGDGWETRRRRGPGFDWALLALGCPGRIDRVVVDTAHFKGNYPHSCVLRAARLSASEARRLAAADQQQCDAESSAWPELVERCLLRPDAEHDLSADSSPALLATEGPVTHVRLEMHPDGGISRLRLFGRPCPETGG